MVIGRGEDGYSAPIERTYRSARFVVMEVHFFSEGFPSFAGVDEFPAESESEADIVAATAPFPYTDVGCRCGAGPVRRAVDMRVVTGAGLDGALGARSGHRVGHTRTCYGVNESRFTASCNKRNIVKQNDRY